MNKAIEIIPLNECFRPKVNLLVASEWAGPIVVTKGKAKDSSKAEGFVACAQGRLKGYILYLIEDGRCEILVLHSLEENRGIGTMLIRTVEAKARKEGCRDMWLVTTNDNCRAFRFYQRFGFELAEVNINAMDEVRRIKPSVPLAGIDGIPLKHEMVFEYMLDGRE